MNILKILAVSSIMFAAAASGAAENVTVSVVESVSAQPVDTLLMASSARRLQLELYDRSCNVTVKQINDTDENFYFTSMGHERKKGERIIVEAVQVSDVVVTASPEMVEVSFTSEDGVSRSFSRAYEKDSSHSLKTYTGINGREFGFNLGRRGGVSWYFVASGIGWGALLPLRENQHMGIRPMRSSEVTLPMLAGVNMSYRRFGMRLGLGMTWRNYVTTGASQFSLGDDGKVTMQPYPDGAEDTRSRLKVYSLQVPLLFDLTLCRKYNISLTAGAVLSMNTSASFKTDWRIGQREYSVKTNHVGQRPISYDVYGAVNFDWLSLYTRYTPVSVMRSRTGLEFRALTIGLGLKL